MSKPANTKERVGYKCPPRASRFKPGQSGNPRGRPKGSKSLASAIDKELAKTVVVNDRGRQRRLPKADVLAAQLVNGAIQSPKNAPYLLRAVGGMLPSADPAPAQSALDRPEDRLVMASIVGRIRAMDEGPPSTTSLAASQGEATANTRSPEGAFPKHGPESGGPKP